MKQENLDKLGELADSLDHLVAGFEVQMGAEFHISQLKLLLPEKSKVLKDIYIQESGENPWE